MDDIDRTLLTALVDDGRLVSSSSPRGCISAPTAPRTG